MTPVDWLIIAVVVLNVILAAMHGFFAEALSMAGLIAGYVVAAWHAESLRGYCHFLDRSCWLEILGFLVIFFAILIVFSIAGRIGEADEGSWGLAFLTVFLVRCWAW